jgi:hypothetical protein
MATIFAMPSHPVASFAPQSQALGAYGCGTFDASVYPAARGAVWTTPYVHSAAPAVTAPPPQLQPAALGLGAQTQQGTLTRGPVAAAAAPATPDAATMQAALAQRMKSQEEEAAALAWLRVKPINLPPREPVLGAEPTDEQFVAMFWEGRRLPRVHCFGAFTQHSFAPFARRDGDGIFALPDLGPL